MNFLLPAVLGPHRVDDQLRVRVSDTALSRDLFPQDYHCLGDNENRPVKWLALESLVLKQFSPASDGVSSDTPFRCSFVLYVFFFFLAVSSLLISLSIYRPDKSGRSTAVL